MLLPSGGSLKKVDYKISNDQEEFIDQTDNKGRSKQVNSSQVKKLNVISIVSLSSYSVYSF